MKLRTIKEISSVTGILDDKSYALSALFHGIVSHNVSAFKSAPLAKRFLGAKFFPLLPMEKDGKSYKYDVAGDVKVIGKVLKTKKVASIAELLSVNNDTDFDTFVTQVDAYFGEVEQAKSAEKDKEKEKVAKEFKEFGGTKSDFDVLVKQRETLFKMVEMLELCSLSDETLTDSIITNLESVDAKLSGGKAVPMKSGADEKAA